MSEIKNKIKKPTSNFTIIPNAIWTMDLPSEAVKLFGLMFSRPDDWVFYSSEIIKHFQEGRRALDKAKQALRKANIIKIIQMRDDRGTFSHNIIEFIEEKYWIVDKCVDKCVYNSEAVIPLSVVRSTVCRDMTTNKTNSNKTNNTNGDGENKENKSYQQYPKNNQNSYKYKENNNDTSIKPPQPKDFRIVEIETLEKKLKQTNLTENDKIRILEELKNLKKFVSINSKEVQ